MAMNMTDINGILQRQGSGQWAIAAPGREPINIAVGEIFLLQDERRLMRRVRMEHADGKWRAVVSHRQPEHRVAQWATGRILRPAGAVREGSRTLRLP